MYVCRIEVTLEGPFVTVSIGEEKRKEWLKESAHSVVNIGLHLSVSTSVSVKTALARNRSAVRSEEWS